MKKIFVSILISFLTVSNLFGSTNKKCDYSNVASAVFTQPAIGVVGLSEEEGKKLLAEDGGISIFKTSFKPYSAATSFQDSNDFTIREILSNIQFFLSTEIVDNSLDKIRKIDWNL